jgi:hypothetical protein
MMLQAVTNSPVAKMMQTNNLSFEPICNFRLCKMSDSVGDSEMATSLHLGDGHEEYYDIDEGGNDEG